MPNEDTQNVINDQSVDVLAKVIRLLQPLNDDERRRVLETAAIFLRAKTPIKGGTVYR